MLEAFRFTWRLMKKRPLRSLLTILQIALGVWIVAIVLSFGLQSTGQYSKIQSTFADSLAKVSVARAEEQESGYFITSMNNLGSSDLLKLLDSEYIEGAFIYEAQWYRDIYVNGLAYRVGTAAEASPGYAAVLGLEMLEGHFFTDLDQEQNNQVVVISQVISKQLFPHSSPLGEKIDLGSFGEERLLYEIIGVYKPLSPLLSYFIPESQMIFPLNYMGPVRSYATGSERLYNVIFLKAKAGRLEGAVADAQTILAGRAVDDLEIRAEYFRDTNRFFKEQLRYITLFLGAFAFVAVVISSVGILSIMLVGVVERKREVGLRKALGASQISILTQVLNESFAFSLLGSVLGLAVAFFSATPLMRILVADVVFTNVGDLGGLHPRAALWAFFLSIIAGQLFGLYPAGQAAKMPPIEALQEK